MYVWGVFNPIIKCFKLYIYNSADICEFIMIDHACEPYAVYLYLWTVDCCIVYRYALYLDGVGNQNASHTIPSSNFTTTRSCTCIFWAVLDLWNRSRARRSSGFPNNRQQVIREAWLTFRRTGNQTWMTKRAIPNPL